MNEQNTDIDMDNTPLSFSEMEAVLANPATASDVILKLISTLCNSSILVTGEKYRYENSQPHPFAAIDSIGPALSRAITQTSFEMAKMVCAFMKTRKDLAYLNQNIAAGTLPETMERARKLLPENLSAETYSELSQKLLLERAKPICKRMIQLKLRLEEGVILKIREAILVTLSEPRTDLEKLLESEALNSLAFFYSGEVYHRLVLQTNLKVAEFNLKALRDSQNKKAKKVKKQEEWAKKKELQEQPLTLKTLKKSLPKLLKQEKKPKQSASKQNHKTGKAIHQGKGKPETSKRKKKSPGQNQHKKAKPAKREH
jgi:hypothetical protein